MALKIPPLALVFIGALLMWLIDIAFPMPSMQGVARVANIVAVAVAAAGIAVCAAGVLSFRRAGTTVNPLEPERASKLVVRGIYRYTRNPMYLGFALLLAAWGMFLSNAVALAVVPAFVLYMNRWQIAPEERALESLFGDDWRAYRRSVRRWV